MFSRFKKPEAGPAKPSLVPVGAAQAAPKAAAKKPGFFGRLLEKAQKPL